MSKTPTKDYLNKHNTQAIRDYLGIEDENDDKFWEKWKDDVTRAVECANENDAEYILSCDWGIYDSGTIIADFNGVIVFKREVITL